MKVFVKSQNKEVELPQNFVSGGEGDVYIKGGYAYKIYHDKKKSINEEKFRELNCLDKENIIKPESLLLNNRGEIIGYMMKAIPNCYSLSRLITNDFRNQYNISNDIILNIIQQMKETFDFIHNKGCLIVDGNEMNYLVSEDFSKVYFIDVDSYQTKTSPANAYSISTLDPLISKNNKFTTLSDWFIFAIISCTLLVGIHPFKGTYKGLSLNIKKGDVKTRMEKKRSIFNNNVSVNSAVRDFSIIPKHYKDWFINIFEDGNRNNAPDDIFDVKTFYNKITKNIVFNDRIKSTKIFDIDKKIIDMYLSEKYSFIKLDKEYIDLKTKKKYKTKNNNNYFYEKNGMTYLIKSNKVISIFNILEESTITTQIQADSVFVIENRIYGIFNNKINELQMMNEKLYIKNSWDIISINTEVFHNVILQKISNKNIFYIPFAESSCSILEIKELENKKIVNSYYKNKMLEVIYYQNGHYNRIIIKINNNMKSYKIILNEETEEISINATTLDNGIYITINDDGEIIITSNNYEKDNINIIKDKNISINNKLRSFKNDVYLIIDNKIEKITIK